jgi:hypothetical protein
LGTRGEDCDDNGACRGAASAAAVAARRRAPGDGPAFTKASAVAKADELADKTAGNHSCPHAQELITFPPTQKTDWGKKRRILEDLFWPQINLARLRAHGLIKKVSGTYRYQVTTQGRQILTALLAARQADVQKLIALAA